MQVERMKVAPDTVAYADGEQQESSENRHHRRAAYPETTTTSTLAASTAFSVGTGADCDTHTAPTYRVADVTNSRFLHLLK
jgi:hypothetical protein